MIRKPFWPESGSIPPQHRQAPDSYAEQLTAESVNAVAPFGWGISRLAIDDAALADDTVRIVALEGRFRSGAPAVLYVREKLERKIHAQPNTEEVLVSIGIAEESSDAPNVANDGSGSSRRYRRVPLDGDSTALRPDLRILLDGEGSPSHDRIPLAKVSLATGRATYVWFVPPVLRLFEDSRLVASVRELVGMLVLRKRDLLAAFAARPLELRTLAPARAPQLLVLSALSEALALLDHADLSAHLSPPLLHEALGDLLGCLESLQPRTRGAVTPYVHENPGPGFQELLDRLRALAPVVAREQHQAFALERRDSWTFSLTLQEPEIFRRRAYLVASGVDEHSLAAHLPAHAKLASAAWLPHLVQSAMRGVPIATEFDPPSSLPSSANHCCFKIDTRSELWADVIQQGSLMVHVPEAPPGLRLTAYVLPDERP